MNNYFSKNLKHLREERGWSQSELSRQTIKICNNYNNNLPPEKHMKPITQASIARWEAGENSPSIDNLVILEETLSVKLPELIGKDLSKSTKNLKFIDYEEKAVIKNILKRNGFLEEGEDISEEELKSLITFAKANKSFILKK